MSGKKGRSGRRRGSGMGAADHAIRGTYRRDRHGPLPEGARVLAMPPARTLPLTAVAVPTVPSALNAAEQAKWTELAARFPHLRVGHTDLLWVYVSAWCDWTFYRDQLRAFGNGSHLMKGPGGRASVSPYVAMARDAMRMLMDTGEKLGFTGSREGVTIAREQSRLEKFLAGKSR